MSGTADSAGLARRLAAMLYDTLLVLPLLMAAIAASLAAGRALQLLPPEAPLPRGYVWLLALGCSALFFSLFWRRGGQTLGMQAWRIRLVSGDGRPLRWRQCLLRCAAALLSLAALGCGYWWALIDRRRRSWHDHLSETHVIVVPKRRRD